MGDVHACAAAPADLNRLIHRRQQVLSVRAQMRNIEPTRFAYLLAEGHHFVRRRVGAGHVAQAGGESRRTFGQTLAHQGAHDFQLAVAFTNANANTASNRIYPSHF